MASPRVFRKSIGQQEPPPRSRRRRLPEGADPLLGPLRPPVDPWSPVRDLVSKRSSRKSYVDDRHRDATADTRISNVIFRVL